MKSKGSVLLAFLVFLTVALTMAATTGKVFAAYDLYVTDKDADAFITLQSRDGDQQLIANLPDEC
jgi:hypothetical protein